MASFDRRLKPLKADVTLEDLSFTGASAGDYIRFDGTDWVLYDPFVQDETVTGIWTHADDLIVSKGGTPVGTPLEIQGSATIQFKDPNNSQNVEITHDAFDSSLPRAGYGLRIRKTADNSQQGLVADLVVEGNVYANNGNKVAELALDESVTGAWEHTQVLTIDGTDYNKLRIERSDAPSGARNWAFAVTSGGGQLGILAYNDDYSTNSALLTADRSGTTIGAVAANGTWTFSSQIDADGGIDILSGSGGGKLRVRRNPNSTDGDDVLDIHLDDAGVFFDIDNDNDSDTGSFRWRYKTGGAFSTLMDLNPSSLSVDVAAVFSGSISIDIDATDLLNFTATSTNDSRGIAFNSRTAISADSSDGWLRLNQAGEFTNGVYTPANIRADGAFIVDSSNTRGLGNVTGQYGTVQTTGTGLNTYSGFSIDGQYVFMSNGTTTGIYNDVDNEWFCTAARNGAFYLYYNGAQAVRTDPNYGLFNTVANDYAASFYSGSTRDETSLPTGAVVMAYEDSGTEYARNLASSSTGQALRLSGTVDYRIHTAGTIMAGTWRVRGSGSELQNTAGDTVQLWQRTA